MTGTAIIILAVGMAALIFALAIVFFQRRKTRKIMDNLNAMLDLAIKGQFKENQYDESLLSSVESRLADYLRSSVISYNNISSERDKIKGFIGDISHQTKTPIANILLYAQLLEEADLPHDLRKSADAIENQAEKLSFLISALVKLSRLETGVIALNTEKNRISELIENVYQQILPKAEAKEVDLAVEDLDWDSAEVSDDFADFDMKWTGEALYNIVDNAVKYTPAGGRVSISAAAYELFARVDVKDTGIGIAEEELGRIFGRFYRSQAVSDAEGVGIGLFLAREVVSQEGGYIKVSSEPGKGSVFSIFLPRG